MEDYGFQTVGKVGWSTLKGAINWDPPHSPRNEKGDRWLIQDVDVMAYDGVLPGALIPGE